MGDEAALAYFSNNKKLRGWSGVSKHSMEGTKLEMLQGPENPLPYNPQ